MGGEGVGIGPVVGKPLLELGDRALALRDLGLEAVELVRTRLFRHLRLERLRRGFRRRGRRGCELVAAADVVGPAAVVGADRPFLDRECPLGDRV